MTDANSPAAQKRRKVRNPKTGRKKTSIACQHCWKSKTRCGVKRPCDRCVRLGHKDCHDRPESTRKRQHTTNKGAKSPNNSLKINSTNNHSANSKGYLASNSDNLPPMVPMPMPMPIPTIPTSLPFLNAPLPLINGLNSLSSVHSVNSNSSHSNSHSHSNTPPTIALLNNGMYHIINHGSDTQNGNGVLQPNLDCNYNGKSAKNYSVSELLIGGNDSDIGIDKYDSKAKKKSKKRGRKKSRKMEKKRRHTIEMSETESIDSEPPLKRRRFSETHIDFRDDFSDGIAGDDDYTNEIIYWDHTHKEIDPFSDSSHYSTTDYENEDPSPAVIFSICHNDTDERETISHYTFTRGSLSKFVSVEKDNSNVIKRPTIPLTAMTTQSKKRDRGVEEDLLAILGPIGYMKLSQPLSTPPLITLPNVDRIPKQKTVIYKQMPMTNPVFNGMHSKGVLSQIVPTMSVPIPAIPTMPTTPNTGNNGNGNALNSFEIQNVSNNLSMFITPQNTPPLMTRITSLIPAPSENAAND